MNKDEKSYFDGGLLQLIGWNILGFLVTVLTLGICYPWAFTMIYSWETKHTVINGKKLKFDGTALQLFGNWIKWLLLTIITLGIYGFWLPIKLKKWKTKHTNFVDIEETSDNETVHDDIECKINSSTRKNEFTPFIVIATFIESILPLIIYYMPLPVSKVFKFFKLFSIGEFTFGISTYTILTILFIGVIAFIKKLSTKQGLVIASIACFSYIPLEIIWSVIFAINYNQPVSHYVKAFLGVKSWLQFIFTTSIVCAFVLIICFTVQKLNRNKEQA